MEARSRELSQRLEAAEARIKPQITLPMQVTLNDVNRVGIFGDLFTEHEDFIRQTIVDALSSQSDIPHANNYMLDAVRDTTRNEMVSIITAEDTSIGQT